MEIAVQEKLWVKNFGPITDVEITIKDINIFVGPVAMGKGTAAKLIAIFKSGKLNSGVDLMATFEKMLANSLNGSLYDQNP